MQYSWPGPPPPGQPRKTFRLIRCAGCGGALYHTKTKGHPRQEDHEQGCGTFIKAMRVIRYVDQLKHAASQSAAPWGDGWRQRRYLRGNAKKLAAAACASDPVAALRSLGDGYQAECQTPVQQVKLPGKTEMAETLMRACWQLALGKDPAPVTGQNNVGPDP